MRHWAIIVSVYFTSDLHLGHTLVAGLRGFNSVEGHDAELFANWRDVVHPKDTVWVLGDVAFGPFDLTSLPGTKHLIAGNHDKCHPMHKSAYNWHARYLLAGFSSIQSAACRKVDGKHVLLSHFPYTADRGEMRFPQWRLPDHGLPLLHGHTHSAIRSSLSNRGTPEIHVGLDAWNLRPVHLDRVVEELGLA